ncbi:MAG: ribosomal subunit interface protein [Lysobacteraceae bacterium]|nr:MAG: ribosomal subunit interface protein [Xanthomonadaceae bacterium]
MQIEISGHQIDVTPALRDYVESKLAKLERHSDTLQDAHVILTVDKLVHRAEATVNVTGRTLHAEASEADMYAAIDALIDKLDRQVLKHKEKLTDHHRGEGSLRTAEIG